MEAEKKAVPTNANQECVGVNSELAGKSEGCAGCPNQKICASGEGKSLIDECNSPFSITPKSCPEQPSKTSQKNSKALSTRSLFFQAKVESEKALYLHSWHFILQVSEKKYHASTNPHYNICVRSVCLMLISAVLVFPECWEWKEEKFIKATPDGLQSMLMKTWL